MYFKYKGDYKGERYFKMSNICDKVIQVCVSVGEIKKGRTNCIGIYMIDKMTMLSNYQFLSDFKSSSKKEFDRAFKKVLKLIS